MHACVCVCMHLCVCVAKPVAVELRCHATALIAYAKTKTQISFAVTAKLISAFVFATRIVQSLFFLNPKFQASSHLLWLHNPVCVGQGRKPRRLVFSQQGSFKPWCKETFLWGSLPVRHEPNLLSYKKLARVFKFWVK